MSKVSSLWILREVIEVDHAEFDNLPEHVRKCFFRDRQFGKLPQAVFQTLAELDHRIEVLAQRVRFRHGHVECRLSTDFKIYCYQPLVESSAMVEGPSYGAAKYSGAVDFHPIWSDQMPSYLKCPTGN